MNRRRVHVALSAATALLMTLAAAGSAYASVGRVQMKIDGYLCGN